MKQTIQTGSLTVVGTGIQLGAHLTPNTRAYIERADKVYYVVSNSLVGDWLKTLNASAESLSMLYSTEKDRLETYREMVETILTAVRKGWRVCAVFYGHPSIFVWPSREALKQARTEGFEAQMLPGISAEDCLFADLEIDPATHGCFTVEATDFLLRDRPFDPTSALVLWQIEVIGTLNKAAGVNWNGLRFLTDVLLNTYPATHPVTIYQAAQLPIQKPYIKTLPLAQLATAPIPHVATLYVPPLRERPINEERRRLLGLA